jgi:hypothetical protein
MNDTDNLENLKVEKKIIESLDKPTANIKRLPNEKCKLLI